MSQAAVSSSGESVRVGSLSHAVASVRGREKVPANKGGRVNGGVSVEDVDEDEELL